MFRSRSDASNCLASSRDRDVAVQLGREEQILSPQTHHPAPRYTTDEIFTIPPHLRVSSILYPA